MSKLQQQSDWAFLAIRLIVAAFFLYHGQQKWAMWSDVPAQMPVALVYIFRFLAIAEPLAAIGLIIGLWTQLAALCLSLVMFLAIILKMQMFHAAFSGQNGWEFELMVMAVTLALAFHGAGKFSLDSGCKKMKKKS